MEARNELVEAEAALEAIKQRRLELAEQIAAKRKAANNNTNLQAELKGTKDALKMATQRVAAAKAATAAAEQMERNAAAAAEAQRERNASNQRERNASEKVKRNAQAAKNAKSISWMNRMGNTLARKFNPTPGIGIAARVQNKVAQVMNPIPGIKPIDYIESAIAEKFNPVAEDIKQHVTNMVNDQKKRIDSALSSINTKIASTTNEQKKNVLNALKSLLEKISLLNTKLAEYLVTYEFIPTWIIFTVSNLSYLLTLILMFYFFFSLGQSFILALIVMRIGNTIFGQKSTVVKQTLEATGVAPAARAMYNISVGEAHRSAAKVAEEERKEEEVEPEVQAETLAQVVHVFQTEAPELQARHRAWLSNALKGSAAAKGAADAAQTAYQEAKAAGKSDDEADAAADSAGIEAAERISPKPVKQSEKDLEIGGLVGAIGGGIMGLFEACGIGRTRRPPKTNAESQQEANANWNRIRPFLENPRMERERERVWLLSDEDLQAEIEKINETQPNSIDLRGIIIDDELINRRRAEISLLSYISKGQPKRNNRTRKAKRSSRKSRKNRRN